MDSLSPQILRTIKREVLKEIIQYGSPKKGTVVKKVMASEPEARKLGKLVATQVEQVIGELSRLDKEAALSMFQTEFPDHELPGKKKQKRREDLPELPGAKIGKVVVRFPPEPSKHPHIGHLLTFSVNGLYARKYKGKAILRYDDTNPAKVRAEFYDSWKDALEWIGFPPDQIVYASDYMDFFYEKAVEFIKKGYAYVCTCSRDDLKHYRDQRAACPHRTQSIEENLELWEKMLANEFDEGEAILRYMGDLQSENTVLLDPVLFRIIPQPHCRVGDKFIVWPTYDFESALMEGITGVTHVMRDANFGKFRIELQERIMTQAGYTPPHFVQYSRYNVTGCITQGRKLRELFDTGIIKDWGDPALCTFQGLKNRGIDPSVFPALVKEVGITKSTTTIDWTLIQRLNTKAIDKLSKRFFAVLDPWNLLLEDGPDHLQLTLPYHPSNPELGTKEVNFVASDLWLSDTDVNLFTQGSIFRLKSLFNIEILDVNPEHRKLKARYLGHEILKGKPIIQWVSEGIDFELTYPVLEGINTDEHHHKHRRRKGLIEKNARSLHPNEHLQLERIGYALVTEVDSSPLRLNYTHK